MNKYTKIILYCLEILMLIFIFIGNKLWMNGWSNILRIIIYIVTILLAILATILLVLKKEELFKLIFTGTIIFFILLYALVIVNRVFNLDGISSDEEKIEHIIELIQKTGSYGKIVFVLLQILQVVVLPLPALLCYVSGVMIYGPLEAFILSSIGVFIGSMICYAIGRFCGRKVVHWLVGDKMDKYLNILSTRGKGPFVIMQLLPFFPDDVLCILAGVTNMNFWFYLIVMLVIRPLVIAVYCFFGSGAIIPFSGWGIPVWILIFVVFIILGILTYKYQDKIDEWFLKHKTIKK